MAKRITQSVTLVDLPDELLLLIATRLNAIDMLALSLTSKRFNIFTLDVIAKYQHFLQNINDITSRTSFQRMPREITEFSVSILENDFDRFKNKVMPNWKLINEQDRKEFVVVDLLLKCTNQHMLDLFWDAIKLEYPPDIYITRNWRIICNKELSTEELWEFPAGVDDYIYSLRCAIRRGNADIVQEYVRNLSLYFLTPRLEGHSGFESLLDVAVKKGNAAIVSILLNHYDSYVELLYGETTIERLIRAAFNKAALAGDVAVMGAIHHHRLTGVLLDTFSLMTGALEYVSSYADSLNYEVIDFLLSHGADVNGAQQLGGPLHAAIHKNNEQVVNLYLSHPHVNVNIKYLLTTAFEVAIPCRSFNILDKLLTHPNFDIHHYHNKQSIMLFARDMIQNYFIPSESFLMEVIKKLLAHGIDPMLLENTECDFKHYPEEIYSQAIKKINALINYVRENEWLATTVPSMAGWVRSRSRDTSSSQIIDVTTLENASDSHPLNDIGFFAKGTSFDEATEVAQIKLFPKFNPGL